MEKVWQVVRSSTPGAGTVLALEAPLWAALGHSFVAGSFPGLETSCKLLRSPWECSQSSIPACMVRTLASSCLACAVTWMVVQGSHMLRALWQMTWLPA
jgi:hypothetical protein